MEQNNLKISMFELFMEMLNIKYWTNFIILGSIISYSMNLPNIFYIFFINLIVNSILALYLIIFKWYTTGYQLFYRVHKNNNISFTETDFKNYNNGNKIITNIMKFINYIIHIIPLIYFINKPIIKNYLKYKTINNFEIIFISLLLGCGYLLLLNNSMYGDINVNGLFSVGVLLVVIITNYLFPQ